ncbi:DUF4924 family protein [Alkalitalea saponilacus]|uniref:DUF4924 domain-containing protein n=1 Tax=Alkalitalea saponilacus TaxID=889453 RepID=A0A1T5AV07_9BACT|nr:DUF4924 family protein [Alkalitalea saponilacus]ASB48590.1 DUF4924 domain-containing protein [Alkalitalea saponilacus]SKB38639.1 protein of unknown function [Alkalitalea saponilacus]
MFTARQKKRDNIAEYILYMWQVEDLIRANKCDMNNIRESIIKKYDLPLEQLSEVEDWWDNLTEMMKIEKKESTGHLQILINTVNELNTLHGELLNDPRHLNYKIQFEGIIPLLKELEQKTEPKPSNDIELMLSALYNTFLLKLKGEKISEATNSAVKSFAGILAHLSKKYKQEQAGTLNNDN